MSKYALTTSDNPHNPFTDFDSWYGFDEEHHYNTCQVLARRAFTSLGVSDRENERTIEEAIDNLVKNVPVRNAKANDIVYVKVINGKTKFPLTTK